MKIARVELRDFGPIRSFDETFAQDTCVVGPNGVGKTYLLSAIAGVCGNDQTTALISGRQVGLCRITVVEGDSRFVFETKGQFDAEDIEKFKKCIPERVNFPLTDDERVFPSGTVGERVAKRRFDEFITAHGGDPLSRSVRYDAHNRTVRYYSGDGYALAMHLFLHDSVAGVPLLLDEPARHLDINSRRIMRDMLTCRDRQLIYVTHDPCMLIGDALRDQNAEQKIIDVKKSS